MSLPTEKCINWWSSSLHCHNAEKKIKERCIPYYGLWKAKKMITWIVHIRAASTIPSIAFSCLCGRLPLICLPTAGDRICSSTSSRHYREFLTFPASAASSAPFPGLPDAGERTAPSPVSSPPETRPWYLIIPSHWPRSPKISRRHWRCGHQATSISACYKPGDRLAPTEVEAEALTSCSPDPWTRTTRAIEGSTTPASCSHGTSRWTGVCSAWCQQGHFAPVGWPCRELPWVDGWQPSTPHPSWSAGEGHSTIR
jgi:hypothetical protein